MEKYLVKIQENPQAIADWLNFAFKLQDKHLLNSTPIKNLARKRARDLDDSMRDKLTVDREYGAIDEFIRVSILSDKQDRMKKVCQNIIISKIPENKEGIYILQRIIKA